MGLRQNIALALAPDLREVLVHSQAARAHYGMAVALLDGAGDDPLVDAASEHLIEGDAELLAAILMLRGQA